MDVGPENNAESGRAGPYFQQRSLGAKPELAIFRSIPYVAALSSGLANVCSRNGWWHRPIVTTCSSLSCTAKLSYEEIPGETEKLTHTTRRRRVSAATWRWPASFPTARLLLLPPARRTGPGSRRPATSHRPPPAATPRASAGHRS